MLQPRRPSWNQPLDGTTHRPTQAVTPAEPSHPADHGSLAAAGLASPSVRFREVHESMSSRNSWVYLVHRSSPVSDMRSLYISSIVISGCAVASQYPNGANIFPQ